LPNDKLPLKYWFDVPNVIAFYLLLKVEKSVFDNKPVLTLLDKVVEALLLKVFQSVEVKIPLTLDEAFDKAFYLLLKVEKSVFDNKPVLTLLDKVVEALLLKVFQSVEVNIPLVVELAFDKAFYLLLNVIKFVFVKYPFYDILAGWLILFNCAFVRW